VAVLLQYASEDLKSDREIVLAAVTQRGWSLKYASDALKADRDIVLVAVTKAGSTLPIQFVRFVLPALSMTHSLLCGPCY
jgi:hypothetical protein